MNDNSLLAGKYMKMVLESDPTLIAKIGANKIKPAIAQTEVTFPLVTYTRDSIYVDYTKDFYNGWKNIVTVSFTVYTEDYDEGLEIINIIRNKLEGRKLYFPDELTSEEIIVMAAQETFDNDIFIQQITFQTMI